MKRPLYLTEGQGVRVHLDGPSLLARCDASAPRRFPLRLLSLVVIRGNVSMEFAALGACASWGIPVEILDPAGEVYGYLLPAKCVDPRRAEMLESFLYRVDARGLYEGWRLSMERASVRAALRRLGIVLEDMRVQPAAAALSGAVQRRLPAPAARKLLTDLRSLLSGRVAAALVRAGFPAGNTSGQIPGINLAEDLTGILAWRHYGVAAGLPPGTLRRLAAGTETTETAVSIFEQEAQREERGIAALVHGFCCFLGAHWRL